MAEEKEPDYAALAKRTVDQGLTPTAPGTLYFTFKRVDGDDFVAPAANAEGYLRKGYTIVGKQDIEDLVSWNAANAEAAEHAAAKAPAHARGEHAEAKASG